MDADAARCVDSQVVGGADAVDQIDILTEAQILRKATNGLEASSIDRKDGTWKMVEVLAIDDRR